MKDIEEIKKTLSYVKKIDINTYSAEIMVGKYRGSVVFSNNERGYEHVSFCTYNGRLPDWYAMCELKDAFFNDEEEAYQIMPKKSEYVNMLENCLHLGDRTTDWSLDFLHALSRARLFRTRRWNDEQMERK